MKKEPNTEPQESNLEVEPGRELLWTEKRKETDEIRDDLGLGVDEGIKAAVTAFMIYDFATNQSCEGHLGERQGEPFPWVQIYAKPPKNWEESEGEEKEKLEKDWLMENLKQRQKMMDYLAEFYQTRETSFDARLTFSNIGAFGGFRVQSFGAETAQLLSPQEQKKKLELYRKEINKFAEFLKKKFFGQ